MSEMIKVVQIPNILCIIDMQEYFYTSEKIIDEVCHQIKLAKLKKEPIILVEYGLNGRTHKKIILELEDYDLLYKTVKFEDDGSDKIIKVMEDEQLKGNLLICGVNRDACIRRTILGLIGQIPNDIHFSESATAGGFCFTLESISGVKKVF